MIMRQKVGIVKRLSHNYENNYKFIISTSTFYFFVIVFVNYFCQFRLNLIILTFCHNSANGMGMNLR